jgi:hypothetical protein
MSLHSGKMLHQKRGTAFFFHFKVSISLMTIFAPDCEYFFLKVNNLFLLRKVIVFAGISPSNFAKK